MNDDVLIAGIEKGLKYQWPDPTVASERDNVLGCSTAWAKACLDLSFCSNKSDLPVTSFQRVLVQIFGILY